MMFFFLFARLTNGEVFGKFKPSSEHELYTQCTCIICKYFLNVSDFRGKLKRAVGQFTPHSWDDFQWGYTDSFRNFFFVAGLTVFVSVH